MTRKKVAFSWSGGKDSAMALHELRGDDRYEVVALFTTVASEYNRVSHHGVRLEILEKQAEAIGLPLRPLYLDAGQTGGCDPDDHKQAMSRYEEMIRNVLLEYRRDGVGLIGFGDIFLEDLRAYREKRLAEVSMAGIFPIWKRDGRNLIRDFVGLGFKAYLTCVDQRLGEAFAGRAIDEKFLDDLPPGVDPCGEYGEYHSFVYDGPIFRRPVDVRVGESVRRDVRTFVELLSP